MTKQARESDPTKFIGSTLIDDDDDDSVQGNAMPSIKRHAPCFHLGKVFHEFSLDHPGGSLPWVQIDAESRTIRGIRTLDDKLVLSHLGSDHGVTAIAAKGLTTDDLKIVSLES